MQVIHKFCLFLSLTSGVAKEGAEGAITPGSIVDRYGVAGNGHGSAALGHKH